MITVHQLPDADPPKVLLRFNYVAPTHDVCALLEREGLSHHFRSVHIDYVASSDDLSTYAIDHLMNLAADKLLEVLGPHMYTEQQKPLAAPDTTTRVEMEAP